MSEDRSSTVMPGGGGTSTRAMERRAVEGPSHFLCDRTVCAPGKEVEPQVRFEGAELRSPCTEILRKRFLAETATMIEKEQAETAKIKPLGVNVNKTKKEKKTRCSKKV